ncbi:DUF4468 domain-containing protein [Lutibacter sp.]|uniref:DUF4468 domain-containing protein n=1 Tax=Lutibacter sp. TaxID=1925666 RepID=UPI0025C713D9|nr:DUF4468 domain-containing protein [Lutibacter sp.]MCF6169073.1 DUF4468 domain-containing protein [Lutibacter sp.]
MKKLKFLLLLSLIVNPIFGQEFPYNDDKKIEFKEIFELSDKLTKEQVLERTEKWANSYWSVPNLINKSDKSITYKVTDKSSRKVGLVVNSTFEIFYNLKVSVKEGKYKYTLSDFQVVEVGIMKYTLEKRIKKKKIKKFAWAEIQKLISSLTTAIKSGENDSEKDDW